MKIGLCLCPLGGFEKRQAARRAFPTKPCPRYAGVRIRVADAALAAFCQDYLLFRAFWGGAMQTYVWTGCLWWCRGRG